MYLNLTRVLVLDKFLYNEQVKQPSASVNPHSQASFKVGLDLKSKYGIFSLYFKLKASNHNLNCFFLLFKKIFPLNIQIIFNKLFFSLILNQWVLLLFFCILTKPNPNFV